MCNKLILPFTILRKAYCRMFSYEVINRFTKGSGFNRYFDYDEAWKESLTFETHSYLKAVLEIAINKRNLKNSGIKY